MRVRGEAGPRVDFAVFLAGAGLAALLVTTPAAAADPVPTPARAPSPVLLDLGLHLGAAYRLGDAPAFAITERVGAAFGVSAYVAPSPHYAFGVAFEHVGLGSERAEGDLANVTLDRDLNLLWAGFRVHLLRTDRVWLSLLLGPGLAWQGVSASGVLTPGIGVLPSAFACSASDSVNVALRAGLGARVLLGSGVSFLADATFDNVRLSSDVIGDCAPGAGTVSMVGGRVGFSYELDLTSYVR